MSLLNDSTSNRHAASFAATVATHSLAALMARASVLRDDGFGPIVTYSRKVFIPLTKLCRDVCGYCTFAEAPRKNQRNFLNAGEVLAIARAGAAAGCQEALFTLGDKPELRYAVAREELAQLGHDTTISYLAEMCRLVLRETGLLPHANPGVMTGEEISLLRGCTVSQGIMLETISDRLSERGGPHFGAPDKIPARRLETIRLAGELAVPFTSGILIGIGETEAERIAALFALRDMHKRYGHLQEIIIQNFRAKPATKMAEAAEPDQETLLRTIALARIIFGPKMNIQAPPNLSGDGFDELLAAGINDWGGVSPVTPDHVNPEAPWPHLQSLRDRAAARGKVLTERLAVYPAYARAPVRWLDEALRPPVLRAMDAEGFARPEGWLAGITTATLPIPAILRDAGKASALVAEALRKSQSGAVLDERDIIILFAARGPDFHAVCRAADELRRETVGDQVRYVVNRNINYTNICNYRCGFCAFSKGKMSENLRGRPYDLDMGEIERRVAEAWDRGATEVCMQGGIHPGYTGETYIKLCETVKRAAPNMHIHAFSPLEIQQGARTLGLTPAVFLTQLKAAGLSTLPGTAAEILDDAVRAELCPDKLSTAEWLDIVAAAHDVGLPTTSTIMFGHLEGPESWARHLMLLRDLQVRTGGITEFVPLPFIHMEAPIYREGRARRGPTFREAVLMHAVARLALNDVIPNIQASWVKMGSAAARLLLQAGANDMGGTLMNESISRAAGTEHGQEMPPASMDALIRSIGRRPAQRTTLYGDAAAARRELSYAADELAPVVLTPVPRRARS